MRLRRAHPSDAHAVAQLHIASWRVAYSAELPATHLAALDVDTRAEQWHSRIAWPTTHVDLAERDGELLGFCAHGPALDGNGNPTSAWEIYGLHVRPQLRGGGVGTLLFNAGLRFGLDAGASELTLWVVATNAPARRFHAPHARPAASCLRAAPVRMHAVYAGALRQLQGSD